MERGMNTACYTTIEFQAQPALLNRSYAVNLATVFFRMVTHEARVDVLHVQPTASERIPIKDRSYERTTHQRSLRVIRSLVYSHVVY